MLSRLFFFSFVSSPFFDARADPDLEMKSAIMTYWPPSRYCLTPYSPFKIFLIMLDMKPRMHIVEISIFSLRDHA